MCLLSYKENKVTSGKMRMIGEGIKRRRNMAKALNNEKDVKKKKKLEERTRRNLSSTIVLVKFSQNSFFHKIQHHVTKIPAPLSTHDSYCPLPLLFISHLRREACSK